jgi:peroxiredoxin
MATKAQQKHTKKREVMSRTTATTSSATKQTTDTPTARQLRQAQRLRQVRVKRLVKWGSAVAAMVAIGAIIWGLLAARSGGSGTGSGSVTLPDFYGVAGQSAQNFTLHDLSNKPVSLSDFAGKRVLLNFWYAACPGCQQEMPDFAKFYNRVKGQNIVILGVNIEDDANTASQFLQQVGATYPAVLDTHQQVVNLYRVTATPSSFFVDSAGILRGSVAGTLSAAQLQSYFAVLQ